MDQGGKEMKKNIRKYLCFFLAAVLTAIPLQAAAQEPDMQQTPVSHFSKGLFYHDTFSQQEVSVSQVDQLLSFVKNSGFNRIYFSLLSSADEKFIELPAVRIQTPKTDNYEKLSYLTAQLDKEDISLSLAFDPFTLDITHPAYRFVRTVVEKGGSIGTLDGEKLRLDPALDWNQSLAQWDLQKLLAAGSAADEILLQNTAFLYTAADGQANDQVSQAQKMASFLEGTSGGGLSVSVLYRAFSAPTLANARLLSQPGLLPQTLVENQLANTIYPTMEKDFEGCQKQAARWNTLSGSLEVIPCLETDALTSSEQPFGISSRIFFMKQLGVSSIAVSDYKQLSQNSSEISILLPSVLSEDLDLIPEGYSLKIPQTLSVSRPSRDITISSSSYYVMGTSNPDLPLYLDGKPIERETTNGGFGVYLTDIPVGTSTYTFSQGSQSRTISITRTDPTQSGISYISRIIQNSMYPYYDEAVKSGDLISFTCTAPAGSSVSVTFQGKTVSLTQKAAAQTGVPATFNGTMTMPDMGQDDATVKIGPVTYTLTYEGATTSYTSSGDLYAIGKNASLAVSANDYINNVYGDVTIEDDFYMTLFGGARDYVEEVTGSYYKLRSGGYLPKSTADILDGTPIVDNQVSHVDFTTDERSETLTLTGTAKAPYKAQMDDEKLTVTLWNTSGIPEKIDFAGSSLFREITVVKNEDGSVTLTFFYQDGKMLWGYNVEYNGDHIVIFAKKAPSLSESAQKPLEGIIVVIDAGHGGEDPGALGVAGTNGPTEKDLNFINSYAVKLILEALGATVHLVSEDNARLSFEERMDPARSMRADFFLSFHHNSTGESVDSSKSFGTEVYYHEEQSKAFAENILNGITTAAQRNARGAYQSYYRVTRMTYAPSLLVELGFVVNPVEYENLCQSIRIYQTALGVADGMIRTIENFQ